MDVLEDEEMDLIQRSREGDRSAYQQLVSRTERSVQQVITVVIGPQAATGEAQRIISRAYASAWGLIPTANLPVPFGAWVARLAIKTLLRHPTFPCVDIQDPVEAALQRLPGPERVVLRLYFADCPLTEIAGLLDSSMAEAQGILYSGIRRLIDHLPETALGYPPSESRFYRAWLIPFLDKSLSFSQREEFEERLTADPSLKAELGALEQILPRLREAVAPRTSQRQEDLSGWPQIESQLSGIHRRSPSRFKRLRLAVLLLIVAMIFSLTLLNREIVYRRQQAAYTRWLTGFRQAPRIVFYSVPRPKSPERPLPVLGANHTRIKTSM